MLAACSGPTVPTVTSLSDYASEVVVQTNAVRQAQGGTELAESACAGQAAAERAAALVGNPDLVHAPLDQVMQRCDVITAGENLSRSDASPEDVVAAWMDSPGHRSNILDPAYTQIGVACVADGDLTLCSEIFLGP